MNAVVNTPEEPHTELSMPAPIVIVGAGPVGIRAAQSLMQRSPATPVVIYGNEPWEPYNRVRLSLLLSGEASIEDIQYKLDIPGQSSFIQHHNCAVTNIDPVAHTITDELGRQQAYTKLFLALGSSPYIPDTKGTNLPGVYTFRSMDDALRLQARTTRSRHVIVIGGGLLGIEAARAMQRLNTEVTIIEHSPRLMNQQLDDQAAAMLREHLMTLGIQIRFQDSVKAIQGQYRVENILLRKGTTINCDTVIFATGIKPNTGLALETGLRVTRGIRVNDQMETSDNDIYAIGECAEHREKIYGLVGPGLEQADVAVHCALGGRSQYQGSTSATNLKVVGKPVFSMGSVGEEQSSIDHDHYIYKNTATGCYRKLVLKRGHLVGAIAINECQEQGRIQEAIFKQARIWPWQLLRFKRTGFIWPLEDSQSVANWPSSAAVCNCTGVTRGQLSLAITNGNNTVDKLIACTGASTVCGSCRPHLAELVGTTEVIEKVRGARTLLYGSAVFLLTMLLAAFFGSIPYASTTDIILNWDTLWRDNTLKQITGYSILTLSILAAALSLRKRSKKIVFFQFSAWRVVHVIVSLLAVIALAAHSGFHMGSNLNQTLMLSFVALLVLGSLSALVISVLHKMDVTTGKKLRDTLVFGHILLFWPVPVLLSFHIFSSYYF